MRINSIPAYSQQNVNFGAKRCSNNDLRKTLNYIVSQIYKRNLSSDDLKNIEVEAQNMLEDSKFVLFGAEKKVVKKLLSMLFDLKKQDIQLSKYYAKESKIPEIHREIQVNKSLNGEKGV